MKHRTITDPDQLCETARKLKEQHKPYRHLLHRATIERLKQLAREDRQERKTRAEMEDDK